MKERKRQQQQKRMNRFVVCRLSPNERCHRWISSNQRLKMNARTKNDKRNERKNKTTSTTPASSHRNDIENAEDNDCHITIQYARMIAIENRMAVVYHKSIEIIVHIRCNLHATEFRNRKNAARSFVAFRGCIEIHFRWNNSKKRCEDRPTDDGTVAPNRRAMTEEINLDIHLNAKRIQTTSFAFDCFFSLCSLVSVVRVPSKLTDVYAKSFLFVLHGRFMRNSLQWNNEINEASA